MKMKLIHLKDFKRFTNLKIGKIPETAKLVVMIGPNGCGKSSVFEAMNVYSEQSRLSNDVDYHERYYKDVDYLRKSNEPRYYFSYFKSEPQDQRHRMDSYESDVYNLDPVIPPWYEVNIDFHGGIELTGSREKPYEIDKMFRIRTAYRNSSGPLPYTINRVDPKSERRHFSLIENDEVFTSSYWKLAFQWLERSSEVGRNAENLVDLQNEIFGELRDALGNLFNDPSLVLKNLGNPLDGDLFQFDKGISERFSFQNLASGEKAAIDLLLDIIVTKAEYDETIFCIDEPEAHIHTKLQGQLLKELYNLIPEKSQLWIATHSIGMVRKAWDLWHKDPDSVVFLDFGKDDSGQDRNFDDKVEITPAKPSPNFWAQTYDVALGDLAELVGPQRIVLCEGKMEDADKAFDAACYNQIFGVRHPETLFISIGAASDIKVADKKRIPLIKAIAGGIQTIRIRDKDILKPRQIKEGIQKSIRTLTRREIENYLLADEVLIKLCQNKGKADKIDELLTAKRDLKKHVLKISSEEDDPDDELESIAKALYECAKDILDLQIEYGSKKPEREFMKHDLAPLIKPGMKVYKELHKDIFGE